MEKQVNTEPIFEVPYDVIELPSKGKLYLGNKSTVNLISDQEIISILSFDQLQLLETNIEYTKPIAAPFKKGDKLGEMTINVPGKKPIVIPLVAEIDVDKINPFARIFAGIKYLVFGTSLDEL